MDLFSKVFIVTLSLAATTSHAFTLSINISDPSAVLLISETDHSLINATGDVGFNLGISLEDFFTSAQDITAGVSISGDFTARGTTLPYNETVSFVYGDPSVQAGDDLSIYNSTGGQNQDFVTSAAPFTGVGVIDLSAFIAALPSIGTTGFVNNGYQSSQGGALGTWTVVPEPSSYATIVGLVGLLTVVGRRRSRQC